MSGNLSQVVKMTEQPFGPENYCEFWAGPVDIAQHHGSRRKCCRRTILLRRQQSISFLLHRRFLLKQQLKPIKFTVYMRLELGW